MHASKGKNMNTEKSKLKSSKSKNKYDLVGIDGNAFAIMGYVRRALIESGHEDKVEEYFAKAKSGNYNNFIVVSLDYVDMANG